MIPFPKLPAFIAVMNTRATTRPTWPTSFRVGVPACSPCRWRIATSRNSNNGAPPFPRDCSSARRLRLWRQSEVVLRMAQSREPNRPGRYGNGLIVASLPDGVWFTPWVRDMTWAAMALARMGHRAEARAALLAFFNARPTGTMRAAVKGANYQVSVVRYFGDGAEEPFFTMEGSPNIEFDDWGEVLWHCSANTAAAISRHGTAH